MCAATQDLSPSLEVGSSIHLKMEQTNTRITDLESELSIKTQKLGELKTMERKLTALNNQRKIELYKVKGKLSSCAQWLSSAQKNLILTVKLKQIQ